MLVYTVTLLGVFTTRWRKNAGCFLDFFFFFFFCDICRTVLQTLGSWVTKYIIIFIYSSHPFLREGGAGKLSIWYYISFTWEVSK